MLTHSHSSTRDLTHSHETWLQYWLNSVRQDSNLEKSVNCSLSWVNICVTSVCRAFIWYTHTFVTYESFVCKEARHTYECIQMSKKMHAFMCAAAMPVGFRMIFTSSWRFQIALPPKKNRSPAKKTYAFMCAAAMPVGFRMISTPSVAISNRSPANGPPTTSNTCASHVQISQITYLKESCNTHLNESRHTFEWVTSHFQIALLPMALPLRPIPLCVTRMNDLRYTFEGVTWHIWMSHGTHLNGSRRTFKSLSRQRPSHYIQHTCVTRMNESRCMFGGVTSHIWMRNMTHLNESRHPFKSRSRQRPSHYLQRLCVSHIWMSHVTHLHESRHTYEWVTAHIWMSHVALSNRSLANGPPTTSNNYVCVSHYAWLMSQESRYTFE